MKRTCNLPCIGKSHLHHPYFLSNTRHPHISNSHPIPNHNPLTLTPNNTHSYSFYLLCLIGYSLPYTSLYIIPFNYLSYFLYFSHLTQLTNVAWSSWPCFMDKVSMLLFISLELLSKEKKFKNFHFIT